MNLIQYPPPPDLGPNSSREAIMNMQEVLLFLIHKGCFRLEDDEMRALVEDAENGVYGGGTFNAVANIRHQLGTGNGEAVDAETARELNRLLEENGGYGASERPSHAAPEQRTHVVSGQVLREDQLPMPAARVRASHLGDNGFIRLGEDITDSEGRYTIRYGQLPGVDPIRLFVEVLDAAGSALVNARLEAAGPLEMVNLVAPGSGQQPYQVQGSVSSRTSVGLGGLRVVVVDKGVGGDLLLQETTTGDSGAYSVSFTAGVFAQRGKVQPDLQTRVYSGETLLGASEVRYNASHQETLHVLLAEEAAGLMSEHEVLTGALARHFAGSLADLREDDDQQDITYLANKSGWDARAVALASLSQKFSAATVDGNGEADVKPVHFYALFRAGLPANEETLYHTDAATLGAIWKQAAEQGIVPKDTIDQIPNLIGSFQAASAQKLLLSPAAVGVSSLVEMLTTASQLDTEQQSTFASLVAAHPDDPGTFWQSVRDSLGGATADRLELDGKLGHLTINNAPLMQKVHQEVAAQIESLSDPLQLAQTGFYDSEKWSALLGQDVPIPKEIPGEKLEDQRANYAAYLAAQVRLSYPTASVAQMVKSGSLLLTGAPQGAPDQVHAFLTEHQGKFEIGMHPVQQYIAQNGVQVDEETLKQVKRLQRVYQITPSDQAMTGLMKRGIDSAYAVTRYDRDVFIQSLAEDVGGLEVAALIYDQSVQVHNAILNVALSYINARTTPAIGVHSPPSVIDPMPTNPGDVIAYANLETLFGSMDFCECEHCRSILSPAAYLVDLLLFLHSEDDIWEDFLTTWKKNHAAAPYPFDNQAAWVKYQADWNAQHPGEALPDTETSPFAVLMSRRPDIQHLPLTCENTNTALPYIDIVNETLEYYIANEIQPLSLTGPAPDGDDYQGHDTGTVPSEDLMASPQYVMDAAYTLLSGESFPPPLPFNQSLETLRLTFDKFAVPLPQAMEQFRQGDDLARGANPYGWYDILMEELSLSRAEFELLTDSAGSPLWKLYGFPEGTPDAQVIDGLPNLAGLSNVKQFARSVGISYYDIAALLKTKFINPNSDLVSKLERLGASFATLAELKNNDNAATDALFDQLLADQAVPPDPAQYGADIKAWVKDPENFERIMGILTLADPGGSQDLCSFDDLEFRYSKPAAGINDTSTRLGAADFLRLLRFIRLWKALGWTIDQTDAALCALFRPDLAPLALTDVSTAAALDAGFLTLLPRLGVLQRVMKALRLNAKRDLLPLLSCWGEIGTHGDAALYRQMFLNPAILGQDAAFADDGYGKFLQNLPDLLKHEAALRSAFQLSAEEYAQISASLGYDASTPLTVANISAIYRRGWLARKLNLSVRELLLLALVTGLDPFTLPDPTRPAILGLVELVQALKERSLTPSAVLYLLWNQDLSGKSAPSAAQISEFARSLRGDFASIEAQFAAPPDPNTDLARDRMQMVYGLETSDSFFALLDDTQVISTPYTHSTPDLEPEILSAAAGLAYDLFRHLLTHTGLVSEALKTALTDVAGVSDDFKQAVEQLFARSEEIKGLFFTRSPELLPAFTLAAAQPPAGRHSAFLAAFQPAIARRRKAQQAVQRFSTLAGVDLAFARTLLEAPAAPYPLAAAGKPDQPAMIDVLALEEAGLQAQFYFRDTATGIIDEQAPGAAEIHYGKGGPHPLPNAGGALSIVWSGQIEAPEAGFYNFIVQVDQGAAVSLSIGGAERALTQNGNIRRNREPIELAAGSLYTIALTVEKVQTLVNLKWETPKRPREIIPARYLYAPAALAPFASLYVRFLKACSLAVGLGLTSAEINYFATHPDNRINDQGQLDPAGQGWLNHLPVTDNLSLTDPAAAALAQQLNASLHKPLSHLLQFARIKASLSPGPDTLLTVLKDPAAATLKPDSLLYRITHWGPASLADVLTLFGKTTADLAHLEVFRRVVDAMALVQKMGISARTLIDAATNAPAGGTVRDLQAALRARYDAASWREFLQPINDALRSRQRDALVGYILQKMRANPASQHIDTPDKLFEYFLMDVQMDPCMQTSRIRNALSSVQLFIERCLMGLEPRVSAAAINAQQWAWMKRYRVWEANRKVYLWPENWAEPELRDDKSPFFKEIESELLQSDITEESAAVALLSYLTKLEEVARLEPSGFYYLPRGSRTPEINHVVARTTGANRKYFYRRSEAGSWTPWENVKLDIEDNPVIPVVWRDRLLLFWLRLIPKAPEGVQKPAAGQTLTQLKTDSLPGDPKVKMQAILCWSEYYNGKWQPMKTSDVNRPATLATTQIYQTGGGMNGAGVMGPLGKLKIVREETEFAAGAFHRDLLQLVAVQHPQGLCIRIPDTGQGEADFFLFNTHSLPLTDQDPGFPSIPAQMYRRSLTTAKGPFNAYYFSAGNTSLSRNLVSNELPDGVTDAQAPDPYSFDRPFFYSDSRHSFYVTSIQESVLVSEPRGYGAEAAPKYVPSAKIPPLVRKLKPGEIYQKEYEGIANPVLETPGIIQASILNPLVTEDAYIPQSIAAGTTVTFGQREIGVAGSLVRARGSR